MKHTFYKSLLAITLTLLTLPVLGQDFMDIHFKDGSFKTIHLDNVKEISTSMIDADGILHANSLFQHILTNTDDEYVFDLTEIDSISFTKYNEQVVIVNTEKALETALPILTECQTIDDAEAQIEAIKKSEGVETAWVEGDFVFIKIQDGEVISFHYDPTKMEERDENIEMQTSSINRAIPLVLGKLKNSSGENLKAVVANQQDFVYTRWRYDQRENFMHPLKNKLDEAGFEAVYLEKPDLDFFYESLFDFDVIFLSTHGGIIDGEHALMTSESLGMIEVGANKIDAKKAVLTTEYNKIFEEPRFKGKEDCMFLTYEEEQRLLDNGEVKIYWVSYVCIKESFFKSVVKRDFSNPNSFFFNAACQSLMGDNELANRLLSRGLGTYVGYTQSNYYGQEAGCTMLMEMLTGVSAEKAYKDLSEHPITDEDESVSVTGTYKDEYIVKYKTNFWGNRVEKERYTASVNLVSDKAKCFIVPVITESVNNTTANNSYKSRDEVVITGFTTSLAPESISCGFEYGLNPHNLVQNVTADIENVEDNENGNCLFRTSITGLIPSYTYYYRAYTYDGLNYNYGDVCSFTIDKLVDLVLSFAGNISLNVDEITTINITSGNGSYDIENSNETVATITVDGEKIDIEAVSPGTTTITVIDNKTGQTASFQVTVEEEENTSLFCPDHNHPHVIDLGLPSGTKWACCNVGSDKPEDYGSYYAWGETQTKETYNWSTYYYCNGSENSMTKYCIDDTFGKVDDKTELDPEDDVATVNWGSNWQIPSTEQLNELINSDYTTAEWISTDGIYGMKITSKINGNSIFLPASGYYSDSVRDADSNGNYWSRSLGTSYSNRSRFLYFDFEKIGANYIEKRLFGQSVRAVVRPETTDLPVSQNKVTMGEGDIKMIQILSGSGSYTCGYDNNGVVNVSINNNTITIEALKIGDVVITVADKESGKLARIDVEVTGPSLSKVLFFGKEVDGATYNVYKQIIDKNDIHTNPDGWKTYKSQIILEVIRDGNATSYVVDNDIYLDSEDNHHSGQIPCMLIDLRNQMIYLFCNSKDAKSTNYTMDGYFYSAQLDNLTFDRQNVFGNSNWGWYPYFTYNEDVLSVQHFSFAGYYAMTSVRNSSSWSTSKGNYIKPDDFMINSMEHEKTLVITDQGGMLCDLANITGAYTAKDGDILTGTLGGKYKISIADGATVYLKDVVIKGVYDDNYKWAGLTCLGDATIVLSGTNNIKGYASGYPGIQVAVNKTLIIEGDGSLIASSSDRGAGIGGGDDIDCGNIIINSGNITATGKGPSAGIGGGMHLLRSGHSVVGDITINGGTVVASGGGAGIGTAGGGYGGYTSVCGNITIKGGNITAEGGTGGNGPGIGAAQLTECGDIMISGGIVTATASGYYAAGIGCGYQARCGNITITNGVTQVTATKTSYAPNSIGAGLQGTCGIVTIGGVEVSNTEESPYIYPAP